MFAAVAVEVAAVMSTIPRLAPIKRESSKIATPARSATVAYVCR